jgi:hypothetical protein
MVQITEALVAQDKAARGLAVSVSLGDDETVETDFYPIKDALLQWKRTHGKAASSVLIEYRTPDSSRQQIEDFWLGKIDNDHFIRELFFGIREVTLCIMNRDGRDIRQIGFELGER